MKIAISTDHRGAPLYNLIADQIKKLGHEQVDVPTCRTTSCDYPDMAYGVAKAVAEGRAERGVLLCGSGIGMSIAANKVKGVRAALCHDDLTAEMSRRHNDANVLCMSADLLGQRIIEKIIQVWLDTEFEGGRHDRRVRKMTAIEAGEDPGDVQQ